MRKLLFCLILFTTPAFANLSLIRDAETAKFLRALSQPIFKEAGLNSQNIKIYIVNDDSINAFVSGGQNVFINTGLIRKYNTPNALIGVIAHETGHITAGHLARSAEGAKEAQNAMLLSYLLGIGAAISGAPDAGAAVILGGSQSAQRLYMKFTRTQEEAADAHAIEYLDKMRYPADGLIKLLEFYQTICRIAHFVEIFDGMGIGGFLLRSGELHVKSLCALRTTKNHCRSGIRRA